MTEQILAELATETGNTEVTFSDGTIYQEPFATHLQALEHAKRMSDKLNIGFTYKLIK